jgi:VWFA-related protein
MEAHLTRQSFFAVVAIVVSAVFPAAQAPPPSPAQESPVFRGGTTLVPVDVRVLDRDGNPVTDLQQSDFTVLENGVRQNIRHFSTHQFSSEAPFTTGPMAARATRSDDDIDPQNRRIFLIVLGRGRLQPPAKGVDGMLHFVREKLLPQDLVAVLAWNRATEFTADHAKIADLLERFKRAHEGIESKMKTHFSGLAAVYGSKAIPASLQGDIDAVFGGARAEGVRTVTPGMSPNADRVADDTRKMTDLLLNPTTGDPVATAQAAAIGMDLDEFVAKNMQTSQDVGNLYMGVEYLRHLDGEKHLVFVSETGLIMPRAEDDKDLAAAAADARVAIDYVHTGGTVIPAATGRFSAENRGVGTPAIAPVRPMARPDMWTFQTARTLATMTGGRFFANQFPSASVDMDYIDRGTRFEYTLGYYPARAVLDGKYRQINVRVNRPGLTLLFRHGYYATPGIMPFDRRRVLTYSRVAATANYSEEVHDIKVQLKASSPEHSPEGGEVVADLIIDPSRLGFTKANGHNTASIEVAVFCADGSDNNIGHSWQTIELNFTDDRLQTYLRDGLHHTVTIPVTAQAKRVKAVVYDYTADLVGSVIAKVQ